MLPQYSGETEVNEGTVKNLDLQQKKLQDMAIKRTKEKERERKKNQMMIHLEALQKQRRTQLAKVH